MRRTILAAWLAALGAWAWACGLETGPDAPPRTNGCEPGVDCNPTDGGGVGVDGGGPGDDGGGGVDPLAGTTRMATLVHGGLGFTEGPVWINGHLLFSDTNANVIDRLLDDGGVSTFRNNSGGANGNAVDSAGNLVTCEGGNHRVTSTAGGTMGGAVASIADTFNAKQFNSPNDVIARADGNIYFTDPNYSGNPDIQDAEAVYRIPPGGGGAQRLAFTFMKPNGISLSPDGNTLYVCDNGAGQMFAAPLAGDGTLAATFTEIFKAPGCDGMAVDDDGNLYVADIGGVDVFRKSGKGIGSITLPQQPSNCTFGGADRKTLFITARTGLYSIVLGVPGLP
ncbi:MAG TPA: SMP-30/gluconolactonase/LRE family protein [Labilithrix sp.]